MFNFKREISSYIAEFKKDGTYSFPSVFFVSFYMYDIMYMVHI